MQLLSLMKTTPRHIKIVLSISPLLALTACSTQIPETLVTFADARTHPAYVIDTGEAGDSVGDVLTFDQPLLDADMNTIGNNSGFCIRTRIEHSFQCQWTLTFDNGSIQVAGREFDQGTSTISIVGGTGDFAGVSGDMESTNTGDGLFRQVVRYRLMR
jgi:hypothetical protein